MNSWKIHEHNYPGRDRTEFIVKHNGRIVCSSFSRAQAESMMASLKGGN